MEPAQASEIEDTIFYLRSHSTYVQARMMERSMLSACRSRRKRGCAVLCWQVTWKKGVTSGEGELWAAGVTGRSLASLMGRGTVSVEELGWHPAWSLRSFHLHSSKGCSCSGAFLLGIVTEYNRTGLFQLVSVVSSEHLTPNSQFSAYQIL